MKKIILLCLLLNCNFVYSYVDLDISYTLSQRIVDGTETVADPSPGEAKTISQGYRINWAWYIWRYTALEFNYSVTNERLKDDRITATSNSSITVLNVDSDVETKIAGIGLKQTFGTRKSAILPSLSAGIAQYTTSGDREIIFDVSGTQESLRTRQDAQVFNSGYLTLSLRFRLTDLIGLTFTAHSVVPDFKLAEAANNVTYSAGFSWIF